MKFTADIEKLLPLGYLYLVILGILKETLYYYQFGINILKYSSIMDILISPIAYITSNLIVLIVVILMFIAHFYLPRFLIKNQENSTVKKFFELKSTSDLSPDETSNYFNMIAVRWLAIFLLSFFIGTGIGSGYFAAEHIEKQTADFNYKINFNELESQQVTLLGTNSLYYFYIIKGKKNINIAPIGSIKNVELIQNSKNIFKNKL